MENWKKLDGKFDEYARLRELRSLVAQGAMSQELYDTMHRYVLEKNLSSDSKKKILRKHLTRGKSKHGDAPALPPRRRSLFQGGRKDSVPAGTRVVEKGGEVLLEGDEQAALWGRKPVMEGFLYKRATKSGRNWKKRYVKLYYDRMDYYSKRHDRTPRGTISLTKDFFVADSILRRIRNTRPHGFMVSDFATTFYLAASSPEAKVYWMHTIQRVLQKLKDQDDELDTPVLLDEPERTPSMRERDYQARLQAYRQGLSVTEVARHVSQRAAAISMKKAAAKLHESSKSTRGSSSSKKHTSTESTRKSTASQKRRTATALAEETARREKVLAAKGMAEDLNAHESEAEEESEMQEVNDLQYIPDSRDEKNARLTSQSGELPEEKRDVKKTDDSHVSQTQDTVPLKSQSKRFSRASSGRLSQPVRPTIVTSTRILSSSSHAARHKTLLSMEREEKTRSLADAALSAHESARLSAQVHLGLDVMSYDQQEDLRDQAAQAEAVRLMADMENQAAIVDMDAALQEKDTLKKELKDAEDDGDEERYKAIEMEYETTRHRLDDLGETMARSAAERAEAEEIAERNREQIARANAANAIVLELAQVDEAILRAEQLAEKAEEARQRAEAAARKVHDEALEESREHERRLAEAEEEARKAQEEEEERALQEQLILKKLEETAKKKVNEKQRKKIEEVAERAAQARAEAEERRFEAELNATELANQRLDALAKAAAVERALQETQAMLNKSRVRQGLEEYGFANPRESRHASAAATTAAGSRTSLSSQATSSTKATERQKRPSFFEKLRPRLSLTSRSQGGSSSLTEIQPAKKSKPKPEAKPAAVPSRQSSITESSSETAGDPGEAANSFRNFFTSFTQAAVDGFEYVTGIQWTGDTPEVDPHEQQYEDELDSLYGDNDDDTSSIDDDEFDERLRNVGEQERKKAASAWIDFETNRLLEIIKEIGYEDKYGRPTTTFGELLEVYEDISDTLVGILIRAKRSGKIYYEGNMLFELEHDDTEITALE